MAMMFKRFFSATAKASRLPARQNARQARQARQIEPARPEGEAGSHQANPAPSPSEAPYSVPRSLILLVTGYAALVNAGAVGLFWYDKHQATTKGWRVRERDLQFTALIGGWMGGLWAMQTFRHKTVKKSFKEPYMIATGLNMLACVGAAAAWRLRPGMRIAAFSTLKRFGLS
ncbi:hypothetical protein BASA62_004278 [Batrachochytrium salamandrivorans]|nr:hypothetical protein BASA62_004278 [Batrachochytrium salamandrivorans]